MFFDVNPGLVNCQFCNELCNALMIIESVACQIFDSQILMWISIHVRVNISTDISCFMGRKNTVFFNESRRTKVPKPYSKESMSNGTFEDISQSDRPRTRSVKTKNKRHRQR